ncbi:MAG: hypothetical protein EBZ67_00130 [Chitinophagia bacterium]|nr:hypothetical protein [Chitinophagia bacterium]
MVNQTLVFQIKFCGKSPALRVAAKRYTQCTQSLYEYIHLDEGDLSYTSKGIDNAKPIVWTDPNPAKHRTAW